MKPNGNANQAMGRRWAAMRHLLMKQNGNANQATDRRLPPGIYTEALPAGPGSSGLDLTDIPGAEDTMHSYLVYRKADGTTEVLRAGPGTGFSAVGSAFGGDIKAETGKSLKDSQDAYGEGDTPESRYAQRLPVAEGALESTWARMRDRAVKIGEGEIDYNNFDDVRGFSQNSNSFIRALVEEAGVNPDMAIHPELRGKLWGYENNLEKPVDNTALERLWNRMVADDGRAGQSRSPIKWPPKHRGDMNDGSRESEGHSPPAPARPEETGTGDQETDTGGGKSLLPNRPSDADPQQSPMRSSGSPEMAAVFKQVRKLLDPETSFLLKPLDQVTEGEVKAAMGRPAYSMNGHPRSRTLQEKTAAWYKWAYPGERTEQDASGRMTPPKPRPGLPENPSPVRDAEDQPLSLSLGRFGETMARRGQRTSPKAAIAALQKGLNGLKQEADAVEGRVARLPDFKRHDHEQPWIIPLNRQRVPFELPSRLEPDLREDGAFGPKTHNRLAEALAVFGPKPVEQAMDRALGFSVNPYRRQAVA